MSVTIKVKSANGDIRAKRQRSASRVLSYFGNNLPPTNILCFFDDADFARIGGERGRYEVIHDDTPLAHLPEYIVDEIYGSALSLRRMVDDLILLYESTCVSEIGLTMTLAHELQHSIQHYAVRKIWAVNSIINQLDRSTVAALKLTWSDIPIEREARIVAKRIAVHLFGERRVTEYIDQRIGEHISDGDFADWQFVRSLVPSDAVDLVEGTRQLFQRMKGHKTELDAALQQRKLWARRDFADVDLTEFIQD